MILNALEGKPLPVYGDGQQIRDWLYVEDHASAIWLALTKGRVGETYNVGGLNERPNLEIVNRICSILDRKSPAPTASLTPRKSPTSPTAPVTTAATPSTAPKSAPSSAGYRKRTSTRASKNRRLVSHPPQLDRRHHLQEIRPRTPRHREVIFASPRGAATRRSSTLLSTRLAPSAFPSLTFPSSHRPHLHET